MRGRFVFERAPGHLIRRAHQVSVAAFAQEMAAFDCTPVQFAILSALQGAPGIDQITLAHKVAFDAATIGSVIGRLQAKGWLRREADEQDRRRKLLWLSEQGQSVLASMQSGVKRVQQRILEPLSEAEQAQLLQLLDKLVAPHGPRA